MTVRLKIKVVVGSLREHAMLRVWECVGERHDVEILAQKNSHEESLETILPVIEFPVIPDMPNFFRDLEKHLRGADVVVGIETSRLYSFQALRVARKMGVPFVCLVNEHQPFIYEKYQNIRAVQYDVHENSSMFFATSSRAAKLLALEGVDPKKAVRIDPVTDPMHFVFSQNLSMKFKKYIKIPENSVVVALKASLDEMEPSLSVVRSFRIALSKLPKDLRDTSRLLICGSGKCSDQLKYEIADMGLGAQTLLLAQDPLPFYRDLLCAADILMEGRNTDGEKVEELPWHLLSMLYTGGRVILPSGSIADEVLRDHSVVRVDDWSPLLMGEMLANELLKGQLSSDERCLRGRFAAQTGSVSIVADQILEAIDSLSAFNERQSRRAGLESFVKGHQVPVSFKEASDVLVRCDEVREFSAESESGLHSEVHRIKGDALMALSRSEEAVVAYEYALQQNNSNHHALRGLGYLAWHGHSHEDAMRFFKRALAVVPNDYQSLVGVGLVYRRLQMFEESVFWLQRAVAVGGVESPSLSLLVQACLETSEKSTAMAVLQSVRDNVGDHPNLVRAIEKLESHQ